MTKNAHSGGNSSSLTGSENKAGNVSEQSSKYDVAISVLQDILEKARKLYPNFTRRDPEFNITIFNETSLYFNHSLYRYVVVYAYDADRGVSIDFKKIKIDGIMVERLPRNKSITYTGLRPIRYLIHVDNKTCMVTFWTIGYIETSRHVTLWTSRPCSWVYAIRYTIAKNLNSVGDVSVVRLILVKERRHT